MNTQRRLVVLLSLVCLAATPVNSAEPVKLIFDTDIGNDVDDALALGMIHALQSRKQCELLAVTITKDHKYASVYVNAVNTFYGRPKIPIGIVKDGKTTEVGKYLGIIHDKSLPPIKRYPYSYEEAFRQDAISLLRKTLASQPDHSVVIVQVGFSTNLSRLLESPPDERSKLPGDELVKQKVKLLSMMAGAFKPIDGNARFCEYNVVEDKAAARHLVNNWPTEIVFSGFEIGIAVPYPAESIQKDYGYVKHHPLAESYILYEPPPHNRPTWDLTSVLHAVCPDRGYFELSPPGQVTVEDDGFTKFAEVPGGMHRHLILPERQIERVKEAFVQLCSQPPQKP